MGLIAKPINDDSLSNARIGYENLLNSTDAGAEVLLLPNTYERFAPPGGAVTTRLQLSSTTEIDFIAIAGHNFGTHEAGGVPVTFQYATTVSGSLIDIEQVKPQNNQAIMILFDAVTAAEIAITHSSTSGIEYAVVYAGKALQMQRPIYGGHSPADLSQITDYQSTRSETGQFLGRQVTRKGLETSFSWRNLDDDWYRDNFQPFVQSAVETPFFMKWRPDHYSDVAIYAHTTDDIKPTNQGAGTRLMSVSMNVRAHSDV